MIGSAPTLSPSDFVVVFNQSMDMMYPSVAIIGECANFKISKNRWVYFDLIDESAKVKFFASVQALPGPLEDGLTLEVIGVPRMHPMFGFSINVATMQVVGSGSIVKAQKLLAKKLEAEGLFSEERKRSLPYPPQKIGLITSVESAAYADFTKIINQRWPGLEIQVIDTLVQGREAPEQLINAIDKFNQAFNDIEALVMIRGGGSADDMAAFSNEHVVRAIAKSRIPTLVAIGHEIDISLAELAADRRASTPSNAAELLVPSQDDERQDLEHLKRRLSEDLNKFYVAKADVLEHDRRSLIDKLNSIFTHHQQIYNQNKLLLDTLDPNAPLKRGYAIVTGSDGNLISSVKQAKKSDRIVIKLKDGDVGAKVND